jgi:hypothetical protein
MRQRTSAQVRNQLANQSVYGYAVGAAVLPTGAYPDLPSALCSPRGVLMAVVDAHGDVAVSQRAVERIIQVYEAIPPDVDRLIALRATLDQARQALSNKLRQGGAAMLLAAITGEQCYAIAEGEVYGYHVLADGQLTPLRLGPTGQRTLATRDRVLICTKPVSSSTNNYDIALALYAHSPEYAARRLIATAERRGQRRGLAAVVYGPRRSLITTLLGRIIR